MSTLRTIAAFVTTYLSTAQQMAERFSDQKEIFPKHFWTPFSINAYACRDGVIIDFVEQAEATTLTRFAAEKQSVEEVLRVITLGKFNFQKHPPKSPSDKPAFQLTNFSIVNLATNQRKVVYDIQVWWKRDVDRWTTEQAQRLALSEVRTFLATHAVGLSEKTITPAATTTLEQILDEYERLIEDSTIPEEEIQSYLTVHPIILTPTFEEVIPKQQIGCGKEYEIDFVIRQEADRYLVVEIEKPSTRIMTKAGDFTAAFSHAERQVIDFLAWIDQNLHTAQTAMPGISGPRGLIVIGRRSQLDGKGLMRLEAKNAATRSRYEFMTFDDLLVRGRFLIRELRSLGG